MTPDRTRSDGRSPEGSPPDERRVADSDEPAEAVASRVVLSTPADLSDWGRRQVATSHFRAYLRRVHDRAAVGDRWREFVDVGCCGSTLDVVLRIEAVEGGARIGDDTRFEYVRRADDGVDGGWRVQSAAGPGASADREH
jgi:hypothetical protein